MFDTENQTTQVCKVCGGFRHTCVKLENVEGESYYICVEDLALLDTILEALKPDDTPESAISGQEMGKTLPLDDGKDTGGMPEESGKEGDG